MALRSLHGPGSLGSWWENQKSTKGPSSEAMSPLPLWMPPGWSTPSLQRGNRQELV